MVSLTSVLPAIAALLVSTASALALQSSMTVSSSLPPSALWKMVGDFCGIPLWHPWVHKCALSADGNQRTITLVTGATVVEVLESWESANHSYIYKTKSGPLPVLNYQTTVSVKPNDKGSTLTLTSTYEANGVRDDDAQKAVDRNIYRSLCFTSPVPCSSGQQAVLPPSIIQIPLSPLPFTLEGYLRRPPGSGPFPAVVLLPGCDMTVRLTDLTWGARMSSWGYVTLTLDSFTPRGMKDTCLRKAPGELAYDAYQGLNFLIQQRVIDPKRAFLVGFGQGGSLTLSALERGGIEKEARNKFRAAAAFYPACGGAEGILSVPALIFVGERDDWNTPEACRKMVDGKDDIGISRKKGEGAAIQLAVLPGAYSSFDMLVFQQPIEIAGHRVEFSQAATDQSSEALHAFIQSVIADPQ
jgi:dienelactone hydrolase